MNKEEILEIAQNGNGGIDERQQDVLKTSFGFGAVVVVILCFAFSVIKAIQGESFYEFCVIIFAYLSATNFYQYKNIGSKNYLISGVANLVCVILDFIGYFLLG